MTRMVSLVDLVYLICLVEQDRPDGLVPFGAPTGLACYTCHHVE